MKLKKSMTGMILIVLYYAVFGAGGFILMMFIMIKVNILVGLAAGFALGIILGITGGELEFIEHRKMLRKRYTRKEKPKEENRVLIFPGSQNPTNLK